MPTDSQDTGFSIVARPIRQRSTHAALYAELLATIDTNNAVFVKGTTQTLASATFAPYFKRQAERHRLRSRKADGGVILWLERAK